VKKIIVILILLLSIRHTHAQYNDARLWLSGNIKKSIGTNTSLHFSQGLRLIENYTRVGTVLSDFGIKYRIGEKWRVSAHYRFSKRRNNVEYFRTAHRLYFDLAYKQKLGGKFDFTFRGRYQTQYTDYNRSEKGHTPKNHIRFKTTMEIDLDKRYTPYIAAEVFYQLNNSRFQNKFDNSRYTAGVFYDINKKNQVDVHYMIIRGLNTKNPGRYYVLSLNYFYSF
jgi:hypothetical protein